MPFVTFLGGGHAPTTFLCVALTRSACGGPFSQYEVEFDIDIKDSAETWPSTLVYQRTTTQ